MKIGGLSIITNNLIERIASTLFLLNSDSCILAPSYLSPMGQYSIGDAIKLYLAQSRLKGSIQAYQIEEVWEKVMGKTIAKYTEKIKVINKTLFITTNVAPLKQELLYQ